MLRLINLLNHRKTVTIEMIHKICGIPRRTAFRYLSTLSEENIPVYFDKDLWGYRLVCESGRVASELDLHHAVLLVTCLRIAQQHLNEDYRKEVDNLILLLTAAQRHAIEEIDNCTSFIRSRETLAPDHTLDVTSALVNAAVQMSKKIEVTTTSGKGGTTSAIYTNPNLVFQREWRVEQRQSDGSNSSLIESTAKVRILA